MPSALISHTVSLGSAAIRFVCVGLLWCQRRCRQLINFISRTGRELFQSVLCARVCSHIQPKNYLLLWHWAHSSMRVPRSEHCKRRRQVHALSICSSHNRTLIAHAIKLIEFRFCFFAYSIPFSVQFNRIQSVRI